MRGQPAQTVTIEASGEWRLSTPWWLEASPAAGQGDETVNLRVRHEDLAPGNYEATLRLSSRRGNDFVEQDLLPLTFAFPQLIADIVIETGAEAEDTGTAGLSPLSALLPQGLARLIVGLREGAERLTASQLETLAREILPSRALVTDLLVRQQAFIVQAEDGQAAYEAIRRHPRVAFVEPPVPLSPAGHGNDSFTLDPTFSQHRPGESLVDEQWALEMIRTQEAWAAGGNRGEGVTIAVIDVGIRPEHPALAGAHVQWVADDSGGSRTSCGYHGTHVAGIAAGRDTAAGSVGVAPDAGLVLLDIGLPGNCASSNSAELAKALELLLDGTVPRPQVVNISMGSPNASKTLRRAVREVYAAGITVVAAAGNVVTEPVMYPAAYPEVLAVAALDNAGNVTDYSARGSELFISAPGGLPPELGETFEEGLAKAIVSAASSYDRDNRTWLHGYALDAGTSMATPAVAGTVALLMSGGESLWPVQVAGLLASSARPEALRNYYGYGRLDALAAVEAKGGTQPLGFVVRVTGPGVDCPLEAGLRPCEELIPVEQSFSVYVRPGGRVEVGSDSDWEGPLCKSGEWFGSTEITGWGEPFIRRTIPVSHVASTEMCGVLQAP